MSSNLLKIAVLVSGRGSNLEAIIHACQKKQIQAEVCVVISNKKEALALEKAKKAAIPAKYIPSSKGESKEDFEQKIIDCLKQYQVELIVLAGFMKIITPFFIKQFPNKIINIHPSLLPAFPGLDAQKQALDHKASISGATVHFVDSGCDTGPIILQERVPVLPNDTVDTLSDRILVKEHQILPKAIDLIAKNKVRIEGRKVVENE